MVDKFYWKIDGNGIFRDAGVGAHTDSIEMSSFGTDYFITYGSLEDGGLFLRRHCVFPSLRTIPNNTHAAFQLTIADEAVPKILIDAQPVREKAVSFSFDGVLTVVSRSEGVLITRTFFPAGRARGGYERVCLCAQRDLRFSVSTEKRTVCSYGRGTKGVYVVEASHNAYGEKTLHGGEEAVFDVFYTARLANEKTPEIAALPELSARRQRIAELCCAPRFESGIPELDAMARFACLRAGESIFDTAGGLMHSPGGTHYYAATWCNDEIEYAGPHFAMSGDRTAVEAALNAYRQYIPFMSDEYTHIPSSVICEGFDIWEGVGDRGDAAMYLYGCSLFCLYLGDRDVAEELFPAIKWCAEYCMRHKSSEGVIMSDTDELEGRFPTDGKANLSTSALCYGGLKTASRLAASLGEDSLAEKYLMEAQKLEEAIESYFGAALHGFETYRYSKGFDTLRAWICLPLSMGITKRLSGTLGAMLSDFLWTDGGLLTCERSAENTDGTVWDRSTLYGFKGCFIAGAGDIIMPKLLSYCKRRLLGDRVPYAVEAYPEGQKRHLSSESALFFRIITEGMFAIQPEGLDSFSFVPSLPEGLPHMSLKGINLGGKRWDIYVGAEGWSVSREGTESACGKIDGRRITIKG